MTPARMFPNRSGRALCLLIATHLGGCGDGDPMPSRADAKVVWLRIRLAGRST